MKILYPGGRSQDLPNVRYMHKASNFYHQRPLSYVVSLLRFMTTLSQGTSILTCDLEAPESNVMRNMQGYS